MECKSIDDVKDLIQRRHLPFDLIFEMILTKLPIKSVVRFKSVSKLWYSTLSSSRFAFAHLKFFNPSPTESFLIRSDKKFQIMSYENGEIDLVDTEVDFDVGREEMDLVGTSNGLVCLGSTLGRFFIIWNPITREFRKYLYAETSQLPIAQYMYFWGFHYCSRIDDYKIVRVYKTESCTSLMVHIYSLRLDKWRKINHDAYVDVSLIRKLMHISTSGLYINEKFYWILAGTILSFDLMSERFDTFSHLEVSTPIPNSTNNDGDEYVDKWLFIVNGCLSMYGRFRRSGEILTVMKSSEEIEQIILPRTRGNSVTCHEIVGFKGSYNILTRNASCVGAMDLTSQPLMITPLMTLEIASRTRIVSYCASLIPLNALNVIRTPSDDA